jgi:hypothetical protein
MNKNLTTDQVQDVLHKVSLYLEDAKTQWDNQNPEKKTWFSTSKNNLIKAATFLINITDDTIQFVEDFIPKGQDKKAAVILVITKLFDYIASKSLPTYLTPFVPTIKEILISVIISNLIEFIVSKYKSGYWKMEEANEAPSKQ